MELLFALLKPTLFTFALLLLTTFISGLAQEKAPVWRASEILRKASAMALVFQGFVLVVTLLVLL